jgi:branched-chain amino acid transport system substrate-binding protein
MFQLKKAAAVFVAGAAVVALAACSGGGSAAPSSSSAKLPSSITIGFVGSLTGPLASSGVNALAGLKAGAAYAETQHKGLSINVVSRDDAGDATTAVAETRELAQQKVTSIYFTTEAFAAAQTVLNQVKIPGDTAGGIGPILAQTGDSKLYKYAFSTGAGTAGPTSIIPYLDYLKKQGSKKIGVLDDSTAYNTSQVALLKTLASEKAYSGLNFVYQSFPSTASDATAQLQSLKDAKVDSVILFSYGAPAVTAMSSLTKIGWSPQLVGELGIGAPATVALIPDGVKATMAAGPTPTTFATSDGAAPTNPITKDFVDAYLKSLNRSNDFNALDEVGAISYDWAIIVADAVAKSGSTNGDAIKKVLTSGEEFKGANGTYKFGPDSRIGITADQLTLFKPAQKCSSGTCIEAAAK